MTLKFPIKTPKRIAIAIGTTLIVGAVAIVPAKANILDSLVGAFGFTELYTSAQGLYNSASSLMTSISGITAGISNVDISGTLGITDPNKLINKAIQMFVANGNTTDIGVESSRMNADAGAKIAGAANTTEGQALTQRMLQQQTNLAAAASTAADSATGAISSLEALQQTATINNAIAQELPAVTTMLNQTNQSLAGLAQVDSNISQEMIKSNTYADRARQDTTNTLNNSSRFAFPLFVVP
jgi:hypothetical protein